MAVSTLTTHSNAIQGIPGVGSDVDIFSSDSSPKFPIGQKYTRGDGAEFVYSHFGGAAGTLSTGGLIVANDVSESGMSLQASQLMYYGSANAISGESIKPGNVGSHYVQIIRDSVLADIFAGGYFQVVGGDGRGYNYRIRGNTAASAKTTGADQTAYIELYEPLQQALSTIQTSQYRIIGNPYANLESGTIATDNGVAGIITCSHAAATFGWVQISGMCTIATEGTTIAAASVVYLSEEEPGHCGLMSQMNVTAFPVGICVASSIASGINGYAAVKLLL